MSLKEITFDELLFQLRRLSTSFLKSTRKIILILHTYSCDLH